MIVVVIKVNAQTDLDIVPVLRRPHTDRLMCKVNPASVCLHYKYSYLYSRLIGKSCLPSTVPLITISESCQCTLAQTGGEAGQRLPLPAEIESVFACNAASSSVSKRNRHSACSPVQQGRLFGNQRESPYQQPRRASGKVPGGEADNLLQVPASVSGQAVRPNCPCSTLSPHHQSDRWPLW